MTTPARRTVPADDAIPNVGVFPRWDEKNRDPRQRFLGRLVRKLVPRHVLEPLRFELYLAWIRLRAGSVERRYRDAHDLLINLGAGDSGKPGWVNVDVYAAPGVNCVYDCRKALPFPDGSARGIFCEHFFEHVDYTEEAPYFLAECRRVLAPGGVLRIVVPDFERYARAYCADDWPALEAMRPLQPGRYDAHVACAYETRMELINVVFRQAYQHKYAYDFETLARVLERNGLRDVRRAEFGVSRLPELCLDHPLRKSESVYVEAIK